MESLLYRSPWLRVFLNSRALGPQFFGDLFGGFSVPEPKRKSVYDLAGPGDDLRDISASERTESSQRRALVFDDKSALSARPLLKFLFSAAVCVVAGELLRPPLLSLSP